MSLFDYYRNEYLHELSVNGNNVDDNDDFNVDENTDNQENEEQGSNEENENNEAQNDENKVNDNESKIGIIVDSVIGNHQTVIKPLGELFKNVAGISGATILGDGSVALILDILRLSQIVKKIEMVEK